MSQASEETFRCFKDFPSQCEGCEHYKVDRFYTYGRFPILYGYPIGLAPHSGLIKRCVLYHKEIAET
jgi:hypothetical protein